METTYTIEFMRLAEPPLAPIKHPSAFHVAYYCISSCFPTDSITGHFKSTIATIADLRLIGNFCHASITRFNSVSAGALALCESPCESRGVSS